MVNINLRNNIFKLKSVCTALTVPRLKKGRVSLVTNCSCGYTFHSRFVSVFFLAVAVWEREIGDSFEYGSGRIFKKI